MIFFFQFYKRKKLTFLNTQVELSGQKILDKKCREKIVGVVAGKTFWFYTQARGWR